MNCDIMDGRDAFLTLAREKHYEFSSLRRAKFSTMAMLVELHNQGGDRFVYSCNICKRHVETRYHCNECEVCKRPLCSVEVNTRPITFSFRTVKRFSDFFSCPTQQRITVKLTCAVTSLKQAFSFSYICLSTCVVRYSIYTAACH